MATTNKYLNNKFLKTLEPLSKLSVDKLSELSNKSTVEMLPAGRTLFRQGEKDKRSYYLVSGQIELYTSGEARPTVIKAKTPEAKYPLVQQSPRPSTAKTKVNSEVLSLDTSLLEMLLESDENPSGHYEVTEISSDDENGWMLKFLQSRAFLQIPTENIQKILMSMTEVSAKKGESIVAQGQNNDFYYIVKKGKCSVCRRPSPSAEDVQIAILAAGDGFGEEALITEGVRNASVKMLEDGILMRLTKENFLSLLVEPLLDYIHLDELKSRASAGDLLVDVRQHKDFMASHLDGAVNTPLSMIRLKLNTFNAERNVIVYCNDASRSTAAAFLLIQHGISCSILKDGLQDNIAAKVPTSSNTSMTNIIANLEAVTNRGKLTPEVKQPTTAKNISSLPLSQKNKSNKIKNQIDALDKHNNEEKDAQKQAAERNRQLKTQEQALKETQKKLEREAHRNKQAEQEKSQLEQEKINLEQQTQSLRKKAESEKLAAERELQKLTAETKKHKKAIEAKKLAEQEAQALREKAVTEKLAAEEKLQQQTEEALKHKKIIVEKQKAEREAQTLREKAEADKLAAELELQEHKKQHQLTEEAHKKVQLESEKIREQANQELAQLREELQKTRRSVESRVKALKEKEKKQTEEEIRSRQQHANDAIKESIEKARLQAANEAEIVRQQALQEAQDLQQEIELKKQKIETEARRIRMEAERDRAATLELARKQAQEIVTRTTEEAEFINIQRQELDQEAENIRLQAEAERHATLEAAKEEAHSIVRKTAEEAQQLDLQRQRIEDEVSRIKTDAEQQKERTLEAAKKEAQGIRLEAEKLSRLQTKKEVEQIRNKTQQQAQELKKQRELMENSLRQADEIRIQAEKEAGRIRLEALQSTHQYDEEISITDTTNNIEATDPGFGNIEIPGSISSQTTMPSNSTMVESEAKSLAQEIVSKLEKAESNRIKDQHVINNNSGLSLASATLKRRSDGRIVLEGEEDIFIFKEPEQYSKQELLELKEALNKKEVNTTKAFSVAINSSNKSKKSTELPDFTIDEPDFDLVNELPSHLSNKQDSITSEFSDFELHHPSNLRSQSKSASKHPAQRFIAIAASLFIAVGVGITFLGINSEQSATTTEIVAQQQDSFKATRVSGIAANNIEIDKKVMSEAELEFEKLLQKWKKSKDSQPTKVDLNSDSTSQ